MNVFEEFLRELFNGEPMIREANICGRSVIGKVDDQIIVKIVLVSTERSKVIDAIGRLIRKNILYATKISETRYCSKSSLIRYASSEHAIRYIRNATYVSLLKQSQNWNL